MAELAIRTIDCGIVAMAALGYGGPLLWQAVTVFARILATVILSWCLSIRHDLVPFQDMVR